MNLDPEATEATILEALRREAAATYGPARAAEIEARLAQTAHWLWLVHQQPLDLLAEEPEHA
ncbi:MAG: hypothetical protein JO247_08295 [Chloroflexi bacterium]|nr:hypothetical protein [Chloroflexota bacterium]